MLDSRAASPSTASHLWYPMAHPAEMLAHPPIVLAKAEGVMLEDQTGHRSLDAVGGLWCVNLGHSCEPVKDAIREQLDILPFFNAFRGTSNEPAIDLAAKLAEFFRPEGLTRAFFTSGGSDSVDTALRLARQYHKIRGQHDRVKFISLKKAYHGTHFGGASVNGNANFRRNYEPLLPGCFHIPCPWPYRNPFNETDPQRLAELCAALLEDEIKFQGADTVAAFIMEPVLGAGGVIPPHDSFMPMVKDICTRHGILLIADEVITGFGRAGAPTGSRLYGVQPDLLCTAKALTNGYFPLGVVMIAEQVAQAFESNKDSFGAIGSGYTYSAHPVGAAAGLAALEQIEKLQVWVNAAERGGELLTSLRQLQQEYAIVGDVRGRGLMACLELVEDRASKTPIAKERINRVFAQTYRSGVMVRISGNCVIVSPPLVISAADVQTIAAALARGLAAA
ncbi:aminotransferase class III-fold pyridoxal phosphate-dependent enzyme [Steroidobacter sp.]|uniref:aminotransferase class III-fold pyridoxal phosphate-dependent enzyme n=1 Tax=Steroidobacter sp. TaxID=1978227 RepID=UPI001A5A977D|nr:aminotransferase class III-fold pyridoxal phosphate-dependent enzyme [Steroidobacter sp.]MBL8266670.1 aminotransferase class III-fold pyridoxal phosphate-dependent enzyme [Steroidobacter sp.]